MTTNSSNENRNDTAAAHIAAPGTIQHHIGVYCFVNGLNHDELAQQLGLGNGNIIKQIVAGTMKAPLSLLEPLASLIEVDKFDLLDAWLQEQFPPLHVLFKELRGRCDITPVEQRMVEYCRSLAGDRDVAPVIIDGRSVVALMVR